MTLSCGAGVGLCSGVITVSLCCSSMTPQTKHGVNYEPAALDRAERRFWRDVWDSVPVAVAEEHGVELREFGRLQVSTVRDLPEVSIFNLVLGAAEASERDLEWAVAWAEEHGVSPYVPVTPAGPGAAAAEEWLKAHRFERAYAWMKFVRGPHP